MTKGKKKRRGVKDKPPEIINNKSDEMIMKHLDVKEKPPDIVACELNCSKCLKVKKHMDAMIKYIYSFSDSVLAVKESLEQVEKLLNSEKINKHNELLETTISLNKKSLILENLTSELCKQTSELDICSVKKIRVDFLLEDKDMTIELCNIVRSRLDDVMKKTIIQKTVELDKVRLNIMKKAQRNLSLQTQQELNEEWECESKLEEKQPKLVKILEKAELVMENNNLEMTEEFHIMDIKVIQVIEIYVDFNFSDIYNPSPVTVQDVTYHQDVFGPGNKEIGQAMEYSWNWGRLADIMESVFTRSECYVRSMLSPLLFLVYDRGKHNYKTAGYYMAQKLHSD